MVVRELSQPRGWGVAVAVAMLKPLLYATTRRTWIDGTKIPATGGCIVVLNHVSYADPPLSAHFVYDHGRIPRYLAKRSLFRAPFVGALLTNAGQIPVDRSTRNAADAYAAAVRAMRDGECVVMYPEGTLTRDPDLWPMKAKTGAARIALETGCPVIPVGQWGAQNVLGPYAKRPHVVPRRMVTFRAGDPVDLEDLLATPTDPDSAHEASDRIMAAITSLVEQLRGEKAPAERFDARRAGLAMTGNPNVKKKRSLHFWKKEDR